jgi:hypothetical protein
MITLLDILKIDNTNLNTYSSYVHGDYTKNEESGGSCYIDNERLIEKVTLTQYITCLIDWELKGDL